MDILISGDFYISDAFQNKYLIDQSVIDLFDEADYRMVNLEAPVTDNEPKNKVLKTGPHLRMSEETVLPYFKQSKVDAVTLANNHIFDYGSKGLADTFDTLKQHNIDYVGAGNNLKDAAQSCTLQKDGMRIAILNFCENEWSIAEEDKPGANPMDIIDNTRQIKVAKATHDKVICIIHGGHEYYHLPSPRMQKQYRFYADNGADAIVGHHTHCIGGYEIYNDVPIIFSLGNFIFTLPSKKDVWYEGLLCKLIVDKDVPIKFEIYPAIQQKDSFQTALVKNSEKDNFLKKIQEINNSIAQEAELQKKWDKLIQKKQKSYVNYLSPVNSISNQFIRAALFKTGLKLIRTRYLIYLANIIKCQAHADILNEVLRSRIKQ